MGDKIEYEWDGKSQ